MLKITFLFIVLLLVPNSAFACEPLIPLFILFGIPVISLFGLILLKAIIFAWLEKSISGFRAFGYMVIANIFSSLIGLCLGLAAVHPAFIFPALPIVYFLSIIPSKRFIEFNPWGVLNNWNPLLLAVLLVGLYFLTFVLFFMALSQLDISLTFYWLLKFSYIFIAITISIGLTTLWEEWIIAKLTRSRSSFLINVLKVNLVTFFLIMAYLAAIALPERLQSKDFLI